MRIQLGRSDRYAIVDDADSWLADKTWSWHNRGYAVTKTWRDGKTTSTLLHRLIMNPPSGMQVDHINGDRLDCRRANLRLATHSQNMMNRRFTRKQATGERWIERSGKRFAVVIVVYKERHRASFSTLADAVLWRDAKIAALHGEFACFG